MPTFKQKPTKKIVVNQKQTTTLDGKHQEILDHLYNQEHNMIPQLKEEKQKYQQKLRDHLSGLNKLSVDELLDTEDKIKDLKLKISQLKMRKNDYLLDNSKYIFSYFENKKEISDGINKPKVLHSFFYNQDDSQQQQQQQQNLIETSFEDENIVNKYLSNIDQSFLDMTYFTNDMDTCTNCKTGELITQEDEGILVCNQCFCQIPYLIDNEKPSYKEPPKEVCFYAYQRINHFREILAQFQAKETTHIPEEVLENIKKQMKKEKIEQSELTDKKVKEILKRLGYSSYYEHLAYIKYKLDIKPPVMQPEFEEMLCNLFMEVEARYVKHCPPDRRNFISFRFTVYKMCELFGQTQFLPYLPMLKNKVLRMEQDEIWKKICEDLDWEFIPTL